MTNHDHDYYHDDCSLCQMEKEAAKSEPTEQELLESILGKFRSTDLGSDSLFIQGEQNGVEGDHWVNCEFKFKDGKLISMELLA